MPGRDHLSHGISDLVFFLIGERILNGNIVNYDEETGVYAIWVTKDMHFVNEQNVDPDREVLEIIRRNGRRPT